VFGGAALDIVNLFGETKILLLQSSFACAPFDLSPAYVFRPVCAE
jgi:hypothetical protein